MLFSMHNKFRKFIIVASITTLLSTSIAFAQGGSIGTGPGMENIYHPSSSYASNNSTLTQPLRQSLRLPARARYRNAMIGSTTLMSMQARAALVQTRRTEIRQMVQERISAIKEKVKQQLAQNLVSLFNRLNQVWTQHFSQLLDRYAAILQKIQDRTTAAAYAGKNITATNSAIQAAQATITSARASVATQAAMIYTPDLSATSTPVTAATSTPQDQEQIMQSLKDAFQTLRQKLFSDLFALRDGPMTNTRSAVQNALKTLEQISGINQVNATSTEATSPNQ